MATIAEEIRQLSDKVKMGLISQNNGMARVLQKLFKYFNWNVISTFFNSHYQEFLVFAVLSFGSSL